MKKILKTNYNNKNLWCEYSKEKIAIGEEYYIVIEEYLGDDIAKIVKADYIDCIDEEEEDEESIL